MKIAIWGAGSFIGGAFAQHCYQCGHEVLMFSRREIMTSCGRHVCYDLLSRDPLPSLKGYDAVFYFSASQQFRIMPQGISDTYGVNTWGALRVAQQAILDGCQSFFYASTGNVYEPSFTALSEQSPCVASSIYAASKLAAEEGLRLCSEDITICNLRIFSPYGLGQKALPEDLMRRVRMQEPVFLHPSPDGCRDGLKISFIYIADLASLLEQLVCLSTHCSLPLAINIAGERAYSLREFCECYAALIGVKPRFSSSSEERRFDLIADITLLRSLLSFQFTPLHEGMQMFLTQQNKRFSC